MSPIDKLRRDLLRLLGLAIGLVLATLATRAYLSHYVPQFPTRPLAVAILCACLLRATFWKARGKSVLGANPPRVKGRLPGNIDILWKLVRGESNEYCAATLRGWEHEYGPTYDMNILWGHQVHSLPLFYVTNAHVLLDSYFRPHECQRNTRHQVSPVREECSFS